MSGITVKKLWDLRDQMKAVTQEDIDEAMCGILEKPKAHGGLGKCQLCGVEGKLLLDLWVHRGEWWHLRCLAEHIENEVD